MSINVTVSGNPISIRRGKMVLADLENVKRAEREHRRRLRMEQVREQSQEIAKSILSKARNITKQELERLEKIGNTEIDEAHNKKLREFARRYQDIENIGYAYENAVIQPDVECLKQAEEEKNEVIARARGEEAVRKLQELNKVVSPKSKRYERLNKVREVEDQRAQMVAKLPKKTDTDNADLSDNKNIESTCETTSKKKFKGVVSKKSPIKRIPQANFKSKTNAPKTPSRISVTINGEDMSSASRKTTFADKSKKISSKKSLYVPKKISDHTEEINILESDDNEPRKTIPVTRKPTKIDHTESYKIASSSEFSDSSSSLSNDSSYYSDNALKNTADKIIPRHYPSPASSKVSLYDHNTRQRNTYQMPSSLVERTNSQSEQTAEDAAREMRELKKQESAMLAARKKREKERSQDARRREKVRKDYHEFLKKLEELYNEDLKLRAKKISCNMDHQIQAPSKTCQDNIKRQKKMDRTFQNVLRNSHELGYCDRPITMERPITITSRNRHLCPSSTPITDWKDPPYLDARESDSYSEDGDDYKIQNKIIELLMKVEKSRRRLLQEYGDSLPDDIFNLIMKNHDDQTITSMHDRTNKSTQQRSTTLIHHERKERNECQGHSKSKIQGTDKTSCKDKPSQKLVRPPAKKTCDKTPARNFVRPCSRNAVKTCDQEIQVEIQDDKSKEMEISKHHPIEPVIKIMAPQNVSSSTSISSNTSTATDVVIDVGRQEITVDHKKRESNTRTEKDPPLATVNTGNSKAPVKLSFENKNGFTVTGLLIDNREIRLLTEPAQKPSDVELEEQSPIVSCCQSLPGSRKNSPKKLSKSSSPTGHSSPKKSTSRTRLTNRRGQSSNYEQRYKTQYTQVSIDSSTESSHFNSTSDTSNSNKLFTQIQAMAARRVITTTTSNVNGKYQQPQETSDASTSYASPPAPTACAMLSAINSSTPILELLDSSANEAHRRARQVSPVSSPETPSPRTMKLPSNIPRNSRASRNLKLLLDARAGAPFLNKVPKCTQQITPLTNQSSNLKATVSSTIHPCTCRNPLCKFLHDRTEEQQTSNPGLHPETLKTYEDLQNVYTERIASLTDLIELVRNEQRGLDLSVMTSETSRLTSRSDTNSQPPSSGTLVKNIEAIQAQLKKALEDSRRIISSDDVEVSKPTKHVKIQDKSSSTSIDLSKETMASESLEDEAKEEPAQYATPTGPPKPRIVSEQRVNIALERFQNLQRPQISKNGTDKKSTVATATLNNAEAAAADQRDDQIVEMLSKEILEQSKSVNKSAPVDNLKDSDDFIFKKSQVQAVLKDFGDSNAQVVSNDEQNQTENSDAGNFEFVPFLAGIPKIARTKSSSSGRGRPPVTLISGPYRPEIVSVSPAHELSTIVEFDTPDTVNKSQISIRSPSSKARRKLVPSGEAVPSTSSTPSKNTDTNITKNKPSLQVAPLPMPSPKQSLNASDKSTSKNSDKSPQKSLEKSSTKSMVKQSLKRSSDKLSNKPTDKSLESFEKTRAAKCEAEKNFSSESMHTLPEIHIEQLQQSQDNADGNYDFHISQISELQSLPDETIDQMIISELCEESKSKSVTPEQKKIQQHHRDQIEEAKRNRGQLTLTSTASLSAISGVSEISTTPSSDAQIFKCPSSSDEMELALKKWGLGSWVPTLKKNREASALGSSSSSDVTPVNAGTRLVTSIKKESTPHELLLAEISDVSSISIKHENKSTERSVLGKAGRTSTPNRRLARSDSNNSNNSNGHDSNRNLMADRSNHSNQSHHSNNTNHSNQSHHSNNSNSDGSVTLSSFSSDINIVVQNQSAETSIPNISFSNNNLG